MSLQNTLTLCVQQAVKNLYDVNLETVDFQPTRKEFPGDITLVVFSMLRVVKGNPLKIGEAIGAYLAVRAVHVNGVFLSRWSSNGCRVCFRRRSQQCYE